MRRRLEIALMAAFALHAGGLAIVRARSVGAPAPMRASSASAEIELDVTAPSRLVPEESRDESPKAAAHAVPLPSPSAVRVASVAPDRSVAPEGAREDALETAPTPAASSSAWSAWSLAMRAEPPRDIGVGTSAVRERAAAEQEVEAANEAKHDAAGMRAALDARDRELGLGSGGPVVGVARDVTAQSLAPVNGHALFEATFDLSGKVTAVRVVDASSDRASWDDVATALQGALRDKTIKVPRDGQHKGGGVAVSVRVESRWQMPDGSDAAPTKVCIAGLPCDAGPRRKKIVISPLGLAGGLPAIGDKPLRVVHAYIVAERAL